MTTQVTSRADFQQLAEVRLEEAKLLLDHGKWDGAYYLAGYAVELAIKSCIISMLIQSDEFPRRRFTEECYTHSAETLLGLARLDYALKAATAADAALLANWGTVKDWSEQKRYHRIPEADARLLYNAVADPTHGVLSWLRACY